MLVSLQCNNSQSLADRAGAVKAIVFHLRNNASVTFAGRAFNLFGGRAHHRSLCRRAFAVLSRLLQQGNGGLLTGLYTKLNSHLTQPVNKLNRRSKEKLLGFLLCLLPLLCLSCFRFLAWHNIN
jgi:hypothetical protein